MKFSLIFLANHISSVYGNIIVNTHSVQILLDLLIHRQYQEKMQMHSQNSLV